MRTFFHSFFRSIPIPTAGVALGLAALGNLLKSYSTLAWGIAGVCAALFFTLISLRLATNAVSIGRDLTSPILAGVSATWCMAMMQLSTFVAHWSPLVAFAAWCVAVAAHTVLIIWFTFYHVRHLRLSDVTTAYLICYVGVAVAAVTGPTVGVEGVGWLSLGFAALSVVPIFVALAVRHHRLPVSEALRPLTCIFAAPMSLILAGYLALSPHPAPWIVTILIVLAQGLYLFVLTQLPGLLRLPFYPSYAAMTFPFVISATALRGAVATLRNAGYVIAEAVDALVGAQVVIACLMVSYVALRYLHAFWHNIVRTGMRLQ